jgi:hypothetical protein
MIYKNLRGILPITLTLDILSAIGINDGDDDVNKRYRVTVQIINEDQQLAEQTEICS